MKKMIITLLLAASAFVSNAQGVQFVKGLNWQQLLEKAKVENKYIFVDCYATWCGPCKAMDAMVYPNEKAGAALNGKFLSIKLQFDATPNDNQEVKQWRETANKFLKEYKIGGYPSFLFFSPDGKLVHQAIGMLGVDDFITMADLALTNPLKKTQAALADYKQGKKDYPSMPALIKLTRNSSEKELADVMVKDYKNNYLNKLSEELLCTKEHIGFLVENSNAFTSGDTFFNLMYNQPNKVDAFVNPGFSKEFVSNIVKREELENKLWKEDGQPIIQNPDWKQLTQTIEKKYNQVDAGKLVSEVKPDYYKRFVYFQLWKNEQPITQNPDWKQLENEVSKNYNKEAAKQLIFSLRLDFYQRTGNWKEFARLRDLNIQETPPKTEQDSWALNMDAWNTFLRCTDMSVLTRALSWSELSIKLDTAKMPNVQLLDTRANLLYKLGRVNEAIAQEEKAIEVDKDIAKKMGRDKGFFTESYTKIVEKMKAGKPAISVNENSDEWPTVGGPQISNDGKYLLFIINNQPVGSNTLIVRATNGDWKMELSGLGTVSFTEDSRKVIFMKGDSACILTLGTSMMEYIPGAFYFQQFKQGKTAWAAIQKSNGLVLRNLITGKETMYADVSQFFISPVGNALLLNKAVKEATGMRSTLSWLSLPDFKISSVIETTDQLGNFAFDAQGTQVAFMISKTEGTYDDVSFSRGIADDILKPQINKKPNKINTIYRYQPGMDKAQIWADDQTPGMETGLKITGKPIHFSNDGARLFFKLENVPVPLKMKENPVMVEVWSYTDAYLQPQQQMPVSNIIQGASMTEDFVAVINAKFNKIIRLQLAKDDVNNSVQGNDFITVQTYQEEFYNRENIYWKGNPKNYLVSAMDGSRKLLPGAGYIFSSPSGKYLYYFDKEKKSYFCYNIKTGVTKNISSGIPVMIYEKVDNDENSALTFQGLTWFKDESGILIPDQYDLWQVDPEGIKKPINITAGYGRNHGIILRVLQAFGTSGVSADADLLLFGFNNNNKDNGYFRKKLGTVDDPVELTIGAYAYSGTTNEVHGPTALKSEMSELVKAKDANVFVVERESEKEAANLFLTNDFKKFTPLTDLQPQKAFNWYITELVNWTKFDGQQGQGILYKPENFDPQKKYPLVFWYYEKNAAALHSFLVPRTSPGDLNVPYFVSNGYLVFVPDITYKLGSPGEGAYNAVVSAAQYLSKRPYVNAEKMGITGHSFGGYETNYLVSRTSLFAAALAASGPTDLVSGYGSLTTGGADMHGFFERNQMRMGKTLWEDPNIYINNSPIFRADKVTTPLLIMHSKKDGIVRWTQAVEWFTALRRLDKRVWLLQYDNETHNLLNPINKLDFTIRMKQFFDHYLMDAPAPQWMLKGIPAKMKGIEDGLSLDTTSATPGVRLPEKN